MRVEDPVDFLHRGLTPPSEPRVFHVFDVLILEPVLVLEEEVFEVFCLIEQALCLELFVESPCLQDGCLSVNREFYIDL